MEQPKGFIGVGEIPWKHLLMRIIENWEVLKTIRDNSISEFRFECGCRLIGGGYNTRHPVSTYSVFSSLRFCSWSLSVCLEISNSITIQWHSGLDRVLSVWAGH